MELDLIFQIAGVGIIVAILTQVLEQSGRKDHATMVSLAGLVIVLVIVIREIGMLFETIRMVFGFN
jgi:stage III sporulation protein AC